MCRVLPSGHLHVETDGADADVSRERGVATVARVQTNKNSWHLNQQTGMQVASSRTVDAGRRTLFRTGARLVAGMIGLATVLRPDLARAQQAAATADDVDPEGKTRPGKFSRREGIERWRVAQSDGGYLARFDHERPRLSGIVEVAYSNGGLTSSFVLRRESDSLQLSLNRERGTFAGVDMRGRATSGAFDPDRERWAVTVESDDVLQDSKRDFSIGLAVLSDLVNPQRVVTSATLTVNAAVTCPCDRTFRQRQNALGSARSLACEQAVLETNEHCSNRWCVGCCRLVGNDCDCLCLLDDYLCNCGRSGDPCNGQCS